MPLSLPERILHRIDWQVIRRLDGILQGSYASLFYGYGLDLADIREYQYGDDIRYIDWNVTARMGTPYVRQYIEDREITAWFLLDLSPSIDFGSERIKRDLLVDFTTTMARLLTRHGNRVGGIFYADQVERVIPPAGGRAQVLRLTNDLLKQPCLDRAPLTDVNAFLDAACRLIRRRALIFIVSDFISALDWEKPLRYLSQRHEVIAVRLHDPREMELPDIGLLSMQDSETGEQLDVDTADPTFRQNFAETMQQYENDLRAVLRRAHVDLLSLSTEDDLVQAIARYAHERKQRKHRGVRIVH